MKTVKVTVMFKDRAHLSFPHTDVESAVLTVKEFYDALGPLRPVTRYGVFHQDAVAAVYVSEIDETQAVKDEVKAVRSVEQMIRDFFK